MRVRSIYLIVAAAAICGCDNSAEPQLGVIGVAPHFHVTPTWLDDDTVMFESRGIVEYGSGWYVEDVDSIGLVTLNVVTGEARFLCQGYTQPRSLLKDGTAVVTRAGYWGTLAIVDRDGGITPIMEPGQWFLRTYVGMDRSRRWLVWDNNGSDHDYGLWLLDLEEKEYRYAGRGFRPDWNPAGGVFAYVVNGTNPVRNDNYIVTFDPVSGVRDTIREHHEMDGGPLAVAYAPDGESLAVCYRWRDPNAAGIYIFTPSTGEIRQVGHRDTDEMSWGPRGIVYGDQSGEFEDEFGGVIWFLDPGTGVERPLTHRLQHFAAADPDTS